MQWPDCTILCYINITAHVLGIDSNTIECCVLGLTEIIKKANAETIKHLVEANLADLGIFLKNDPTALTNNAEVVMKNFGNMLGVFNQLCHNHALHLPVMDCFHIPKKYIPDETFDDIKDLVDDDMEEEIEENLLQFRFW